MNGLEQYLSRNTDCSPEMRKFIEQFVDGITKIPYLNAETKKEILSESLCGISLSEEAITHLANGIIPPEYVVVPVEVSIKRFYRVYVRLANDDTDEETVKKKAVEQILEEMDNAIELDEDLDIQEDDILGMDVDWDGLGYAIE